MTGILILLAAIITIVLQVTLLYAVNRYITAQKLIKRATKKMLRKMNQSAFQAEQEIIREARKSLER